MPLLFATGNRHKFKEVQAILSRHGIGLEQKALDLPEPASDSLRQIALAKARQAFERERQPLIAEDTGFFLEAFPGFPGTNPKWVVNKIGLKGILKLVSGKKRKAWFHTVICFIESPNSHKFFEGKLHGKLAKKARKPGADTMPYNKVFIPQGERRTISQMKEEEKLAILQRTIAAKALAKWLKERSIQDLVESI